MSIRLEVLESGEIEVMRSWVNDPMTKFLRFDSADTAIRIVEYLIRREVRRVAAERFVPQVVKEGRQILKRELKARKGNGSRQV